MIDIDLTVPAVEDERACLPRLAAATPLIWNGTPLPLENEPLPAA